MESIACKICNKKYDDPVECLKCNNNFCRKHVEGLINRCPICKNKPFEFRENIWLSRVVSNIDFSFKCTECGYMGDKNSFWSHLIESHKNEIINKFNECKIPNPKKDDKDNISNMQENEDKITNLPISDSINISNNEEAEAKNIHKPDNDQDNFNLFNSNLSENNNIQNNDIDFAQINRKKTLNKKNEYKKPPMTHRLSLKSDKNNHKFKTLPNENKKLSPKEITNRPIETDRNKIINIHYCGKKNESIKCDCCPDHICRQGNCLCVNCMRYNIIKNNLKKEYLINRAGKISKFFKGSYYCESEYDKIIENIMGMQFKNHSKCQYPLECCNDCQVLNKFKNIYNANY